MMLHDTIFTCYLQDNDDDWKKLQVEEKVLYLRKFFFAIYKARAGNCKWLSSQTKNHRKE